MSDVDEAFDDISFSGDPVDAGEEDEETDEEEEPAEVRGT